MLNSWVSLYKKQKQVLIKMHQNKQKNPQFHLLYTLKCGLASFLSTCVSGVLLHPLELIKVRFQSHDGQANQENIVPKYRSVFNAFKQIIADQGFTGLYKGLSVTVVSAAIASSLFFAIYQRRKKALLHNKNLDKTHQMYEVLLASVQSGIIVTFLTQPMWVVKTRMLLNTNKNINQKSNIIQTIKQINQQHRFKGFYKGLSMNLLLSFSGAIQMLSYEGSKKLYQNFKIPQTQLMQKNFICGGIAKICTVIFTYPFTTVRTRIQQNQYVVIHPHQQKYHNVLQIISKTFQRQGIRGFYKGISANILRGIPQRSIFFYSYQILKKFLLPQYHH